MIKSIAMVNLFNTVRVTFWCGHSTDLSQHKYYSFPSQYEFRKFLANLECEGCKIEFAVMEKAMTIWYKNNYRKLEISDGKYRV